MIVGSPNSTSANPKTEMTLRTSLYTIKFKRRDDIFHVLDIVTKTVGGITYKVEKDESISICPLK